MALNKPALKTEIVSFLTLANDNIDEDKSPESAIEEFAERLATAIDTFVRSGTVTTFGSSSTQTGAIT